MAYNSKNKLRGGETVTIKVKGKKPVTFDLNGLLASKKKATKKKKHGGKVHKMQEGGDVFAPTVDEFGNPLEDTETETDNPKIKGATELAGLLGTGIQRFGETGKKVSVGASTAGGALKGAAKGTAIGTAIAPGIGTAIGAVGGALVGGIKGLATGKQAKEKQERERSKSVTAAATQGAFTRGTGNVLGKTQLEQLKMEQEGAFTPLGRIARLNKGGEVDGYEGGGTVSVEKAKKILKDGKIRGKALTEKQKRFFGLIAGGGTPTEMKGGGRVVIRTKTPNVYKTKEGDLITGEIKGKGDTALIRGPGGKLIEVAIPKRKRVVIKEKTNNKETTKTTQKKNKGGEVEGPGTGTSDDVKAKIKTGSFVVPAKNAALAKELRKMFLGGSKNKKAKLKQGGGVDVRLSDGEEIFTPQEVKELEANGVNLDALAPDAENKTNEFQDGGSVGEMNKRIADIENEIKLEQAKSGEEENEKIKKLQVQHDKLKSEVLKKEYRNFSSQLDLAQKQLKSELQRLGVDELERANILRDQLDNLKDLKSDFTEGELATTLFKSPINRIRGIDVADIEDFRKQFQDVVAATQQPGVTTTDVKDIEVQPPQKKPGRDVSNIQTEVESDVSAANNINTATNKEKEAITEKVPKTVKEIESDIGLVPHGPFSDVESPQQVKDEQQQTTESTIPPPVTEEEEEKGIGSIAGITTGLGAVQTGFGLVNLLRSGERPEDQISPELSSEFQQIQRESLYGLSPQERAAFRKNIRAGRVTATEAIKATTTSPAQSYALIKNILAQGNKARLDVEALNQKVKQAKVARRGAFAGQIDQRRRQLFTDKLRAFEQNQMANAELVSAGLKNIIDAGRLRIEEKEAESRAKQPINISLTT